MTTNSGNNSVAAILAAGKKEDKGQSAYGMTVRLICKDLTLLNDRARLLSELKKAGINTEGSKNAIQTGISQTRNIVTELTKNGYTK